MAPRTKSPEERLERERASQRRYREKNRERLRASSLARYYKDAEVKKAAWRDWYGRNKESVLAARRAYYQKNRDALMAKTLERQRKRKYGLELCDVELVLEAQGGRCSICEREVDAKSVHVDHDHATNELRGLLCGLCNSGLGYFRDDPVALIEAAKYLAAVS